MRMLNGEGRQGAGRQGELRRDIAAGVRLTGPLASGAGRGTRFSDRG